MNRIHVIALVELDKIDLPIWAEVKAIKGLTLTKKSVWLRRKYARYLEREDIAAGGKPKLTFTWWKPCKLCKRQLLGLDAENRYRLDQAEGTKVGTRYAPCDEDCIEIERQRKENPKKRGPKPRPKPALV